MVPDHDCIDLGCRWVFHIIHSHIVLHQSHSHIGLTRFATTEDECQLQNRLDSWLWNWLGSQLQNWLGSWLQIWLGGLLWKQLRVLKKATLSAGIHVSSRNTLHTHCSLVKLVSRYTFIVVTDYITETHSIHAHCTHEASALSACTQILYNTTTTGLLQYCLGLTHQSLWLQG